MELMHHGIKGMKWGVRKDEKVFISGSSKTQTKESEYYRKSLHPEIRKKLDIFKLGVDGTDSWIRR